MISPYYDEQIILKRRGEKQVHNTPLENGLYVGDKWMFFSRQELLDGKISVILPATFIDLPPEIAKIKYPSKDAPDEIKSSLDTAINFTFRLFQDAPIQFTQLEGFMKKYQSFLTKMNPSIRALKTGEEQTSYGKINWLHYSSFAVDGQIFNIAYLTRISGCLMIGGFHCPFKDRSDWWSVVQELLRSLQDNRTAQFNKQSNRKETR